MAQKLNSFGIFIPVFIRVFISHLYVFLYVFNFFSKTILSYILLRNYLILMDKETLIRLATPLSITLLAMSIATYPLLTNAYGDYDKGGKLFPLHVKLVS